MRNYKSGTTWCFWRWSIVDSDYIRRLHILKTPWFALCLHWLRTPDPEPYMHDHPVSFLSIILRGGYTEKRFTVKKGMHTRVNRWWNWTRATPYDRHTIMEMKPHTVTLCFMGPKTREWGFTVPVDSFDQHGTWHPGGWSMWKDYYKRQRETKERATRLKAVALELHDSAFKDDDAN